MEKRVENMFQKIAPGIVLILALALPSVASADCSHKDFRDKEARIAALIHREQATDAQKAHQLQVRSRAIADNMTHGDIIALGHACGQLDDLLANAAKQHP